MGHDVAKRQRESKKKISAVQKKQQGHATDGGDPTRNTPAGRRMAALRAKKAKE